MCSSDLGGSKALGIHLGGEEGPFTKSAAKQKMSTAGVIHLRDLDGVGLEDFVIFDPHNFDEIGRLLCRERV